MIRSISIGRFAIAALLCSPLFAAVRRRHADEGAVHYAADYRRSLEDSEAYWLGQAGQFNWMRAPTRADESSFQEADFGINWFADGILKVSANCLDRHLESRGD